MGLILSKKKFTAMKHVLIRAAGVAFLVVASATLPLGAAHTFAASAEQALALTPVIIRTLSHSSLSISTLYETGDRRHTEALGGFSYVPPAGWQLRDFPGLKYKVVVGPVKNNVAPNLIFMDEAYSGSLDNYVSISLVTMNQMLPDLKIIGQESFLTAEGKRAIKVVVQNTQQNLKLQQTVYFFDLGAKKLVVPYTRLVNQGMENDLLCDSSMKTLRIEN